MLPSCLLSQPFLYILSFALPNRQRLFNIRYKCALTRAHHGSASPLAWDLSSGTITCTRQWVVIDDCISRPLRGRPQPPWAKRAYQQQQQLCGGSFHAVEDPIGVASFGTVMFNVGSTKTSEWRCAAVIGKCEVATIIINNSMF